jgi:hypothetical protein
MGLKHRTKISIPSFIHTWDPILYIITPICSINKIGKNMVNYAKKVVPTLQKLKVLTLEACKYVEAFDIEF